MDRRSLIQAFEEQPFGAQNGGLIKNNRGLIDKGNLIRFKVILTDPFSFIVPTFNMLASPQNKGFRGRKERLLNSDIPPRKREVFDVVFFLNKGFVDGESPFLHP